AGNMGTFAGVGASLPLFRPEQQQNWLAVVASGDNPGAISGYSNICGGNKYWCVASSDNGMAATYTTPNNTNVATPGNPASPDVESGGGTSEASATALGSLA